MAGLFCGGLRCHTGAVRKSSLAYPLLLLIFWSVLVLTGDYVALETSIRQVVACGFATTPCQIVHSALGHGAVSRRGVDIVYSYTVNGVDYTGHCYRYVGRPIQRHRGRIGMGRR